MNTIDQKFRGFKEDLVKDLREKYKTLRNKFVEINKRITIIESKSVEMESLCVEKRQQENYPVSSQLRMNEISFRQEENPPEIFRRIYNTIDTPILNLRSIYRLRNLNDKHNDTSKDAVIIVKLWSAHDKIFFFNC